MKKTLIFLIVFGIHSMWGQNREWHVKPDTNNSHTNGNGSIESPWSLQNALNNPNNAIQHGDIIWLHGGDYKGHFTSSAALNGTPTDYIKVISYPGEWARIDGNIHPYVAPPVNAINSPTNTNQIPLTLFEELSTNLDESPTGNIILSIKGKFVRYENFEITCLGPINRLSVRDHDDLMNCEPLNGFNQITGINENPVETAHTKNRYVNLVIRNIAGHAMGSWKYSDDSEIYGCVFYNNGYILKLKSSTCQSTGYSIIGRGAGMYTQNASSSGTVQRIIRNNIFLNNYDSGVLVWSADEQPTFDFVKNFSISKNIFINNGGPQRDETPNLLISTVSENANNHPSNINVDNNIFYHNSRSSFYSGILLLNTKGVNIHHNFIYKGTGGVCFNGDNGELKPDHQPYNNTNINFYNNFYWGKRMHFLTTAQNYLACNWQLSNNDYYSASEDMITIKKTNPSSSIPLESFQSLYSNAELGSERYAANYANDGTEYITLASLSPKTTITQNEYNSNRFYVTIFNPNATNPSFDNISVDFSSYNIPAGTNYVIRDPQNYFGATISGVYNNGVTTNTITFPMTLTSIEIPIGAFGIDYQTTPVHSLKDMAVFIVEFGCSNIPYDINRNSLDTGTQNYKAKNNVFFNSGYLTNATSVIDARASKSIVIKSNTLITGTSKFLAKIEATCPDLSFVGEQGNFRNEVSETSNESTKEGQKADSFSFSIYPNPNSGIFTIESTQSKKINSVVISRVDSAAEVLNQKFNNDSKTEINISREPKGLYIVKVFFEDNTSETKTIFKK